MGFVSPLRAAVTKCMEACPKGLGMRPVDVQRSAHVTMHAVVHYLARLENEGVLVECGNIYVMGREWGNWVAQETKSRPGGNARTYKSDRQRREETAAPSVSAVFAYCVRALRRDRTQRDVAKGARISIDHLSKIERGRRNASERVERRLIRVLGQGRN